MAQVRQSLERELKLGAPPGFELPDLQGEPLPRRTFTSTYFDTASFRLARAGVTLRRRVENRAGLWQLKLPRDRARLELELPGGPSAPPALLRDLITAYVRGADLCPVARLRTKRSGVMAEVDGVAAAEVTIDHVSVVEGRRILSSFRELEVELAIGASSKALRALERTLRAAGAVDGDERPKVYRALDLPAPEAPPTARRDAPLREHLRAMLGAQYQAILAHDPGTRLGTDPEELHQMRVATRRLRAFLRAARPALVHDWAASLRLELGWLGGMLGPVRDLDVLLEHLHEDALCLEQSEQRALRRLFRLLEAERAGDRELLLDALRSDRYLTLLDRLETAVSEPQLVSEDASVVEFAAAEFRRLRKAARRLGKDPADEELHELRIQGKRARYAAELAEPITGKGTGRFLAAAKVLQDVLGDHQDTVVAEERIRAALRELGGQSIAFAGGRLVERERERRRVARAAFPAAWKQLARTGKAAWT